MNHPTLVSSQRMPQRGPWQPQLHLAAGPLAGRPSRGRTECHGGGDEAGLGGLAKLGEAGEEI